MKCQPAIWSHLFLSDPRRRGGCEGATKTSSEDRCLDNLPLQGSGGPGSQGDNHERGALRGKDRPAEGNSGRRAVTAAPHTAKHAPYAANSASETA